MRIAPWTIGCFPIYSTRVITSTNSFLVNFHHFWDPFFASLFPKRFEFWLERFSFSWYWTFLAWSLWPNACTCLDGFNWFRCTIRLLESDLLLLSDEERSQCNPIITMDGD